MPEKELIRIDFLDIPPEVGSEVIKYGVTMVGIDQVERRTGHQGSGTLIRYRDRHFILTAYHVAEPLQSRYTDMGLAISGEEDGTYRPIPMPLYVAPLRAYGPDLAFLVLDDKTVEFIKSRPNKEFYDIETFKAEMLSNSPRVNEGYWGLVGSPKETCDLDIPLPIKFTLMAYSVWPQNPYEMDEGDGFDYIDVPVALDKPGVLSTYDGASGGGLWQMDLARDQDRPFIPSGPPKLEGCLFMERNPGDGKLYLTCHSRRSLYEKGINRLDDYLKIGA